MIIDIHTHAFPDALAAKAVTALLAGILDINEAYIPVSDGTIAGLLKNMDDWGIDVSVLQPVVTKESQVRKTNEWVRSVCSDRIVGFGGIYPHSADWKSDVDFIADLGFKGIKLHPEYQGFTLDEPKMLPIYDYALSRNLNLLFHAGYDPAFPAPFKSSPQQFAKIASELRLSSDKNAVIIAAHLGGHSQWDDVEKYLPGSGVYIDTSVGFDYYSKEQFLRIVEKLGSDKVLFGSDAPWSNARADADVLRSLPLPENVINDILGANAQRILGI